MSTAAGPLSLREYAKHRAEFGLVGATAQAVSKAIERGRLVRSVVRDHRGQPKISDPVLADREWADGTDHSKAPASVKERAAVRPSSAAAAELPPRPAVPRRQSVVPVPDAFAPSVDADDGGAAVPPDDELSLTLESAREKFWKARTAELDYRKRAGELVEAKELEGRLVDLFSGCQKKLLGVPSRARQQDPTLTPAHLALVEELIREALEDLASAAAELASDESPAAAAAGGA